MLPENCGGQEAPKIGAALYLLRTRITSFQGFSLSSPYYEFMEEDLGTRLAQGSDVSIVRFLRHFKEMEGRRGVRMTLDLLADTR